MILRQIRVAYEGTEEFFGRRALVIGLIPVVYWTLNYFLFGGKPITERLIVLGASYAATASAVFLVQFVKAGKIIEREVEDQRVLDQLSPDEQKELRRLVLQRKVRVGQNVFDQIAGKTLFVYRGADAWRVEEDHRKFLERWAKNLEFR